MFPIGDDSYGGILSERNEVIQGGNLFDIRYFNGLLGDFQACNRPLSEAEVQFLSSNPGSAIASEPEVTSSYPYHVSYTGSATPPWNRLDTSKTLVQEGNGPQHLTYNNLINSAQGLNGIIFRNPEPSGCGQYK